MEIAINLEVLSEWLLCDYCLILSLQMPENNFGIPIKEKATFHLENYLKICFFIVDFLFIFFCNVVELNGE